MAFKFEKFLRALDHKVRLQFEPSIEPEIEVIPLPPVLGLEPEQKSAPFLVLKTR